MFMDIVENVKINVEESITRLGSNGIQILNLVVPKPDIPNDIAQNYKAVKVQWTEQLVAIQEQKTEEIKKQTQNQYAKFVRKLMLTNIPCMTTRKNFIVMELKRNSNVLNALVFLLKKMNYFNILILLTF